MKFAFTPFNHWVYRIAFASLPWVFMALRDWQWPRRFFLKGFPGSSYTAGRLENEGRALEEGSEESSFRDIAEENRKLIEQVAQLKAFHEHDHATLSEALKREQEGRAVVQRSLHRVEDDKRNAIFQNQELTAECDGLRRQLDSMDVQLKTKDVQLNGCRNQLHHVQKKHDELFALLEARTRELKGAQVYLTKADTLSGAEVISLVDALNNEIQQTSAIISDAFSYARQPPHIDETTAARNKISECMGPSLTHLLGTVVHSEDPLLVQLALQCAMVEYSRWIITTWDFNTLQAEHFLPLGRIYIDIRATETQAVSGRWRALTRTYAQRLALQQTDIHATTSVHLSNILVTILVAAGCTMNHNEIDPVFTQKFGERISNVVRMAARLNKAMGEEVTSADLWPVSVTWGNKFDRNTTDNFESSGEDLDGQTVLCTIALGLQRAEKVVQGEVVEFKETMLVKPKVVLELIADALERHEADSSQAM